VSVEEIVGAGGDADDVLRAVVAELVEGGCAWAGIWFVEGERLELGPEAGTPDESRRVRVPIRFRDERVGELGVDGTAEAAFVERVAALISPHVLLGWDTGGETWTP
jgi:putative methionine-R-sulfoxide reductase with GAF domain